MTLHADSPSNADTLAEVLEVLRRGGCLVAAHETRPDWLRVLSLFKTEPIPAFGHQTLMQLVEAGRTDDVMAYLESVSAGYTG